MPILPPELTDCIIEHLAFDSWSISSNEDNLQLCGPGAPILACSLVARSWVATSRKYMLPNGFYAPRSADRFERLKEIFSSPHCTLHLTRVRQLILDGRCQHSSDSFGLHQFMRWCGTSLPGPGGITIRPVETLFGSVESVQFLDIVLGETYGSWNKHLPLDALHFLCDDLPKVKSFHLNGCRFSTAVIYSKFIESPFFQKLDFLDAKHVEGADSQNHNLNLTYESESISPLSSIPALQHISLGSPELLKGFPLLANLQTAELSFTAQPYKSVGTIVNEVDYLLRGSQELRVLRFKLPLNLTWQWDVRRQEHPDVEIDPGAFDLGNWPQLQELHLDVHPDLIIPILSLETPHPSLSAISIAELKHGKVDLGELDRVLSTSFPQLRSLSFKMVVGVRFSQLYSFGANDESRGKSERVRKEVEGCMPWCAGRGSLNVTFEHVWDPSLPA
ncbi:hypothetical protein VNI00_010668 [Paramarasmius palmivorus]|uniref:F-box domain-containing protein n=1 Tax=Paramarasmius palmivorus TaxID=297713 RepID=A0AAW0CIP1_9AGAR